MTDDEDTPKFRDGFVAVVKVALADTAKNYLHPIHNIRVALGFEQEESFSNMVRDEQKRMIDKRKSKRLAHS